MNNPTLNINTSFQSYVEQRTTEMSAHMVNGIPDYYFPMDYALRKKINSIPGVYGILKAISQHYVPYQKQVLNLDCVAVGPTQYPHIYKMAEECARRLGIGVPQIYIKNDITNINAAAYALEDGAPLIEITTALIERFSESELKVVIGHECGHIQNNHSLYSILAGMLAGTITGSIARIPGLQQLLWVVSLSAQILIKNWSRCAEVTCDRASIICSDNPEDAMRTMAKLAFGGSKSLENINLDAFIAQVDKTRDSIARFNELMYSHPILSKRVLANKLFVDCDTLYEWRPEWKTPGMETRTKSEIDKECESFISVATGKKHRGGVKDE